MSIYRNEGNFVFVQTGNIAITNFSSASWGDFDNDGDLDILLCSAFVTTIYLNDGAGAFTDMQAGLPGQGFRIGVGGFRRRWRPGCGFRPAPNQYAADHQSSAAAALGIDVVMGYQSVSSKLGCPLGRPYPFQRPDL